MLRAYGLRIAMFAFAGLLVGLIITLTSPKKYEAIVQVMVDTSQSSSVRTMTKAEESVRDILDSPRPRTVSTQVEQLTGFGVLGRAVASVYQKLGKQPGSIDELGLMNLQKAISVEAANLSDIITLRVRMKDPELARLVANEIYLAFDAQNQELSKEVGARALTSLERQTTEVKTSLNAVDAQMEALRRQYGAPAVDLQIQNEYSTLRALDEGLEQAKVDYASSVAQASTLREQMTTISPTIKSSESIGVNGNYQRLEAALADANSERAQLLTQWQKGSPAIKAVDEKIRTLEAALKKTSPNINSGSNTSTNPLYQSLSAEVAQAEARASAAQQRIAAASSAVASKRSLLMKLPEMQRKMEDLKRQQESLSQTYLQYQDSLNSIRIAQRGRVTPSTLVSPAFVNPDPVSPKETLNLLAGLMAGLLFGVLSAFSAESKKSPIRNLTHLNRLAFEPSFRTIPELPRATPTLARMPDDAFVALLGNFVRSGRRPYRLGVLGVDPNSGATTTAASLAVAAALEGRRTLLVDTAEKNGSSQRLNADGSSHGEHLTILKAVTDETGTSAQLDQIQVIEQGQELCVFDLQPFRENANPLVLARGLDECILLVRSGQTKSVDFLQAQQMLNDAGVPQVTVVLSRTKGLEDDFSFVDPETPALTTG